MKNENNSPVVLKLSAASGVKSTESLRVYVVNSGGEITETAPFSGNEAVLTTGKTNLAARSKIYVAQAIPDTLKEQASNELTLLKMSAYEVARNFNGHELLISRLPGVVIEPFPFHFCMVTGQFNKTFTIDGVPQNLPLCDMRVHICNVETELRWPFIPIYYRRIPDWVLQEIALKIVNWPPKSTLPDPPVNFTKANLPLSSLTKRSQLKTKTKQAPSVNLPENVLNNLNSGSADLIRQTFIDYHDIIFPYFCFWPYYWPWIYVSTQLSEVTTDCNGHFEAWELTFGNNPLNIYIWVEANINGQWVTVYRPALPCNTLWGYQCGTDINITVSDTRVTPCSCGTEGPEGSVWFVSIGSSAPALHIAQDLSGTVSIQNASLKNVGCTDAVDGQLLYIPTPPAPISPFGGGLIFQLFCGANIFDENVAFYRWKYTNVADANLNTIPTAFQVTTIIPGSVTRPYLVQLSPTTYETHYVNLGAVGNAPDIAYHIPHQTITDETLISAADQALNPHWSDVNFESAYLDTTKLTDGLYRFELELLSQDSAGNFEVVPVPRASYQVSEYATIGNSQNAPDNYLNPPVADPSNPVAVSLSYLVRIDNNACTALINDAALVSSTPPVYSGICGFIKYGSQDDVVELSFEATQPHNFATFAYGVVKGNNTTPTNINPEGYVISSVDGFNLSGGEFSEDFSVGALLNGCPAQAAFAENLNVASTATDGTYRLSTYDRGDTKAFALSNT